MKTINCEEIREQFAEALYGELSEDARAAFEAHLAGCVSCAKHYASMRETLSVMDKRTREELSQPEWDQFWQHLHGKLSSIGGVAPKPRLLIFRPMPAWAYGIAALLVLAVGMYLGKTFLSPNPVATPAELPVAVSTTTPDTTTQQALAYLERSRNLLIGVANLSDEHSSVVDLSQPRQISRTLVDQGNVLAVALNKPDQQLLRQLIRDLQIILLQLANMESRPGVPVVEFIRKGIDEKSILLKINLEQMRSGSGSPSENSSRVRSGKNL